MICTDKLAGKLTV